MTPTLMSLLPVVANVARHTKFHTDPGVVLLHLRAGNEAYWNFAYSVNDIKSNTDSRSLPEKTSGLFKLFKNVYP